MNDKKIVENNLYNWCIKLFPICRSITGIGTKKTLSFFEKINPKLTRIKFKSGQKVFDWVVPYEWNINNAYIQHSSKKKFCEFKNNNLHVVNYSEPVNSNITKENLLKKIYTYKKNKKAIPYVTSYYKKDWGFCMSENAKKKLPNGKYKVVINSSFKKGTLDISHAVIKGMQKKEIFFSSYVCHPSMANNELSGPVVLNGLLKYIENNYPKTNFSYRFALVPETIGSIAYLSRFFRTMKKNTLFGFNLSCLGDGKAYSIIRNLNQNCLSSKILNTVLRYKKNLKIYDFSERGSDERQYCSPNVNLPICGFSRSKFGEYPEYHTSLDNLNLISSKSLKESLQVLALIVDFVELSMFPKLRTFCEPNLSKRNMYPTLSKYNSMSVDLKLRKDLLAYCDGNRSIFEVIDILTKNKKIDLYKIYDELKFLIQKKLIK